MLGPRRAVHLGRSLVHDPRDGALPLVSAPMTLDIKRRLALVLGGRLDMVNEQRQDVDVGCTRESRRMTERSAPMPRPWRSSKSGARWAVLLLALFVGACSSPLPSLNPSGVPIRLPAVNPMPELCAGVGLLGATLTGDPHDPRVAWLKTEPTGSAASGAGRLDVVFPPGFSARFDPGLEILDPAGRVVASEGDPINGGCDTGGGPLLVLWP